MWLLVIFFVVGIPDTDRISPIAGFMQEHASQEACVAIGEQALKTITRARPRTTAGYFCQYAEVIKPEPDQNAPERKF